MVEIDGVEIKRKYIWKTTSTKILSTKCKFELAKKYIKKNLIDLQPELFYYVIVWMSELTNIGLDIRKKEYIDILNRQV
jgi:hypothetical protein